MTEQDFNKFKIELRARKYSKSSIETYLSCLKVVDSNCPEGITFDKAKVFFSTIKNRNYHKQLVAATRNYLLFIHGIKTSALDLPYPITEYKLPEILSISEIRDIFSKCHNLKHKTILSLLYGCGLRVGEVLALKPEDIDRSRMLITIRQGKGNKDRQVMLDPSLLKLIENYYREFKPKEYLFNGQFGNIYSASSINQFIKYYSIKSGIKKRVHAHIFRHSFATHLLEGGTDIKIIQELLGHSSPKTTQIYTHVSNSFISKVKSPLSFLK